MLQNANDVENARYWWSMAEKLKHKKVILFGTSSYQLVKQDILKAFYQNESFYVEAVLVLNF
jgi:hypothetical protein